MEQPPIKDNICHEKATCPSCGSELYVRYLQKPQMRILGLVDKQGVITNTKSNPDLESIYNFWNEQHIITHRSMTSDTTKAIKYALRDFTEAEIIQAIKNYAEIQSGEQYWFKYIWTLKDFLRRGIAKFIDFDIAKRNYLKRDIQPKTNPVHKRCEKCNFKALTNENYCPQCSSPLVKDYTAGKYGHSVRQ